MEQKCIMIIAGEASGDLHGAKIVKAMRNKDPDLFFCGIGGQDLKDAGVRILMDASKLAVVGLTEVFSRLPDLLRGMAMAKSLVKNLRPDLLILIDFPDFNFRIAARAKKIGIPVLYYISPQLWAWRSGRVKKIQKRIDHMAVILPFEEAFYKKHNIPVTFVGHPLLDNGVPANNTIPEKDDASISFIGLLPGSRSREIVQHLPVMLDAAKILSDRIENVKFIVSCAPGTEKKQIESITKKYSKIIDIETTTDNVVDIFDKCCFVIAASGTVTLQAAISCVPMVVIYKISPLSFWLGKTMIRVKYISLVNLIADKPLVPELLQKEASAKNIADKVSAMLNDAHGIKKLRREFLGIRDILGGSGASERVADIALRMM